ncbi:MAG: transglycosylase domain-containing protein [Pseudomonadota bacterium]
MLFSRKKKKKRVEPRLASRNDGGLEGLALTADDRVLPKGKPGRKPVKKAATSKRRAVRAGSNVKQPKGARRAVRKPTRQKRSRNRGRSFIGGLFYWTFVLSIWGGIGLAGVLVYYAAQLPSASTWAVPDRPPNVKIVSTNGTLIGNRGATGGQALGLHEMSPYIPQAVVAIEDRRFFNHFGFDPKGFARAMAANVAAGRLVQGGSTLTQQLAKNLFLSADRTVGRKAQEVLLALWLEQQYSKEQILEMYLNRVYFGSGAYGVEAAARRYFNKSARDVSLPEAALLAGLLKAPSRLSPARNPEGAEERAQLVLSAMRDQGLVSDSEMTAAMARHTTRAAKYWTGSEHYVADAVMEQLPELIGGIQGDLIVDTTVDLALQKFAEGAIRDLIAEHGSERAVSQGALVSIDRTGAVRALVGGHDYANSQFDRAREAKRQPGSAFKPFVYMAAIEQGYTPSTIVNDAPVRIGKWQPENYNEKYYGDVPLSTALSKSLNSVAARLMQNVGSGSVIEAASRLGIESRLDPNASLALGTSEVSLMELTSAYTTFASGGWRNKHYLIKRVTTSDGKVLYEHKADPWQAISPQVAGMMSAMMQRTVSEGTATRAQFGHPAAGKTGTTQNSKDAWFVGYTANLTTGVWFGNDDNTPMKKVTGGFLPAEAWKQFMVRAHEGVPVAQLPDFVAQPQLVGQRRPQNGLPSARAGDGFNFGSSPNTGNGGNFPPPPDPQTTASTGQPRGIVDIILGR